jgi:N-acetyl-D-muramate 6-phosphate phosphatase
MRKPVGAVMFDLDGTLLDTAPDFIAVVNQLLSEQQLPRVAASCIRAGVSHGSKALIKIAFNMDENDPQFEPLRQRLLELYLAHIADFTRPFPGIEALLQQLAAHQIPWGIATNKPAAYTLPLLAALDMQPAPMSVICPDHVSRSKPDAESLLLAAQQLKCKPEEIIYIGDHRRDIECGKNAGCITIATAYGYLDESDNIHDWNADYCVNHANEIWPIVKQYLAK